MRLHAMWVQRKVGDKDADLAAKVRALASEHRLCGPKYEGCYSHVPMPHRRACGMAVPCDVERIASLIEAELQ